MSEEFLDSQYIDIVDITLTPGLGEGTKISINGAEINGVIALRVDADIRKTVAEQSLVQLTLAGSKVIFHGAPTLIDLYFNNMGITQSDVNEVVKVPNEIIYNKQPAEDISDIQ